MSKVPDMIFSKNSNRHVPNSVDDLALWLARHYVRDSLGEYPSEKGMKDFCERYDMRYLKLSTNKGIEKRLKNKLKRKYGEKQLRAMFHKEFNKASQTKRARYRLDITEAGPLDTEHTTIYDGQLKQLSLFD